MAKKKFKQQQKAKSLPTAPAKAVITAPAAPVISAPRIAAPVIAAAPKAVVVAPEIGKPPVAHPPQAVVAKPPVVAPKPVVATPTGKLSGTVVSRVYHAKTEAVLYGRIYCPETDKYYVAHSSNGVVPIEGSTVNFNEFVHERAGGQKTTAAKNIVVTGVNDLVTARMAIINKLPVYALMKMEDLLNMSGDAIEIPNIIGATPEGELICYIKETRI